MAAGAEQSSGTGGVSQSPVATPYFALGGRLTAELPLWRALSLRGQADLLVPLVRTEVMVGGAVAWLSPEVSGALALVLVVRFA